MHPTSDQTSSVWLTPSEAARYLGVSVRTVERYIEAARLDVRRLPSGHRRISRESLDVLLSKAAS